MIYEIAQNICVFIYIAENNYSKLEISINSLKNIFDNVVLVDTTIDCKTKKLNFNFLENESFCKPELSFTDFVNFSIKNSKKEFTFLVKSGEIINESSVTQILNTINNTFPDGINFLITYLDPVFPFVSFIEMRLFKTADFSNSVKKIENLYNAEIYSTNLLNDEKPVYKTNFQKNIDMLFSRTTERPNYPQNLFYIAVALNINREYENSSKIFEKYIPIELIHSELKFYSFVYQGINYFSMGNKELALEYFNEALSCNFPSLFSNIWLNFYYMKIGEYYNALKYLGTELEISNDAPFHQKYLLNKQKEYCKIQLLKLEELTKNSSYVEKERPLSPINIFKKKPVISAMLAVKNEEKYIRRVLNELSEYVDSIAILDDASTDSTVEIVKEFPKVKVFYSNQPGTPRHEGRDRNILFQKAKLLEPDWFLCLDGDEIFEDRMKTEIWNLVKRPNVEGYLFQMFHFWRSETHFRIDGIWRDQFRFKLFKNKPGYTNFENKKLHTSSMPVNLPFEKIHFSDLRIKHYGYADYKDAERKYEFYEREDIERNPADIGAEDYSHLVKEKGLKLIEWEEDLRKKNRISLCYEINEQPGNDFFKYIESIRKYFVEIYLLINENINDSIPFNNYPFKTIKTNSPALIKNNLLSEKINSDWVLFLNSDEYILETLINEIRRDLQINYDIILEFEIIRQNKVISKERRLIRTGKNIYFFDNTSNNIRISDTTPVKDTKILIYKFIK